MTETTLRSWGNSQGVIIPKSICEQAHASIGDKFILEYNRGAIVLRPERHAYGRKRVTTIEELFDGWDGSSYVPPDDYPLAGNEIDWGDSVGREVVR